MARMTVFVEMAVRDIRGTKRLIVVKSTEPAKLTFASTDGIDALDVIEQYHIKKLNSTFMPFITRGQLLARVQDSGRKHYRPVLDLQHVKDNATLIYHPCTEMQAELEKNKCLTPAIAKSPPREMNHTPTKTLKRKDRTMSDDRLRAFMQLNSSSGSYGFDPTESSRGSADDLSDDDLIDSHGQFMKPKLAKSSSKIRDVHNSPMASTSSRQALPQVDMLSRNFAQLEMPVDSSDDEAVALSEIDNTDIFMTYHPRRHGVPAIPDTVHDDVFVTSSSRPSINSPSYCDSSQSTSPCCLYGGSCKSRPSLESTARTSRPSSDFSMSDVTLGSFDETMSYFSSPSFSYRDSVRSSSSGMTINVRSDFDSCYVLGHQLGKGTYSTVYEACSRSSMSEKVAVKVIDKVDVHEPRFLFREIDIMTSIHHSGIVELFDVFETADHLYLVLELAGRELFSYIDEHGPLSEAQAHGLIRNLLRTVLYLHERGIVHRDIKPENILLARSGNDATTIKLSDFGIARRLHGSSTPHTIQEDTALHSTTPRERFVRAHTQCGTRDYIAPEVMSGKGYGLEADMWSVGVVLYVIMSGYAPSFTPNHDLVFNESCWDAVSAGAKDLMGRLLVRNPETRMTAAEALQHPWLISH
ncbi:CAMK protein kinase [Aphanomyces invadans]|uniref:CAMK protein kinase n=1 Tax=Aphanomyces invadans TaxID=157072 RepID=A0A024TRS3_9STRA|nr:CAMK protein kinase [Aphanomyces invadans]ETV96840.1 CAMK protein kinase [Aphanomyces invadans]|eukprot:XP_008874618.1 CAMK protein kinase [Aphanomyces invadans]